MIQSFARPEFSLDEQDSGSIRSLPDLVKYNATQNPNHVFALQEIRDAGQHIGLTEITFFELEKIILQCTSWLSDVNLSSDPSRTVEGDTSRPVALYLESDLTLFVWLCALLQLRVPVVLVSARLNTRAVAHLISQTSAQAILCSKKTRPTIEDAAASLANNALDVRVIDAVSYRDLQVLSSTSSSTHMNSTINITQVADKVGSVILHSSGTTGLPKPIRLTNRYILGYAACHQLKPEDADARINVSTLPLYHGFGLLPPCLSLSTGKTCVFPSASIIPAADSTIGLLKATRARSLMTVPTILEQIVGSANSEYRDVLASLDFVAIGGGALKPAVGEILSRHGVKLLNHYGATEIGAVAYICIPDDTFDWHYLRLRTDMGLKLREIVDDGDKTGLYKLSGHPFGWDQPFEIQDRLELRSSDSDVTDVRILGRTDDVIVLATGEKVSPQPVEDSLAALDYVRTAVVFGQQRTEVGVLVELEDWCAESDHRDIVDKLWQSIESVNKTLDGHSRVSAKEAVLVKPPRTIIPRSDKGSVMRNDVAEIFKDEINAVYEKLGQASATAKTVSLRLADVDLKEDLRALVRHCLQDRIPSTAWTFEDDFFERGMDSLEATRLARTLGNLRNAQAFAGLTGAINPTFVYRNPTVSKLAAAMKQTGTDSTESKTSKVDRMLCMLNKFKRSSQKTVVLLTGSTGNLGAHALGRLARDDTVDKIICLNRERATASEGKTLLERQKQSNARYGVTVPDDKWGKIELSIADTSIPSLGVNKKTLDSLYNEVTHIIHNAWPMDFQRSLESYESQVHILENLINFCKEVKRCQSIVTPKFIFLSSIAVAGQYPERSVSESPIDDPGCVAPMGYAEAKWVCEQLIQTAAQQVGDSIDLKVIRIGQVAGSASTGYWNRSEHVPQLLKISQETGALPDLQGSFSWLPVDTASQAIVDIALANDRPQMFYHVENPIRQPWKELLQYLGHSMGLARIPFDDWIWQVERSREGSTMHLLEFLKRDFLKLSGGEIVLSTEHSRAVSPHLQSCNGVSLEQIDSYMRFWKLDGHLNFNT